jgi:hypothetical protein
VNSPNETRRLPDCRFLTHEQIGAEFHRCYDNTHPDLTPWRVEEIHRRWTRLGRLVEAGRL